VRLAEAAELREGQAILVRWIPSCDGHSVTGREQAETSHVKAVLPFPGRRVSWWKRQTATAWGGALTAGPGLESGCDRAARCVDAQAERRGHDRSPAVQSDRPRSRCPPCRHDSWWLRRRHGADRRADRRARHRPGTQPPERCRWHSVRLVVRDRDPHGRRPHLHLRESDAPDRIRRAVGDEPRVEANAAERGGISAVRRHTPGG
jgi:hypothetical protein